jgi:hypothetical protein
MSLDRRIVTILFQNGISDVTKVEKFLGEKDNYYEIIIDGELKKLRIPGHQYEEVKEIFTVFEKEEEKEIEKEIEKEQKYEADLDTFESNVEPIKEKQVFEQKSFEEELLEAEKESKKLDKLLTKTVITKVTKTKKPKKLDDDIDDFINTI